MKTHDVLEANYLENDANSCPYCGSKNITGDAVDFDCLHAFRGVSCNDCEETWMEVFEMSGILTAEK